MEKFNTIFCFVIFIFSISNFSHAAVSSFDDVDIKKYQQIYKKQFEILRDLEKSAELQLNELGIKQEELSLLVIKREKLQESISDIPTLIQHLEEKIEELQKSSFGYQKEIADQKKLAVQNKKEIESQELKVATSIEVINSTLNNDGQLKKDIDQLNKKIRELKEDIIPITEKIILFSTIKDENLEKIKEHELQIINLQQQISSVVQEKDDLSAKITIIAGAISDLDNRNKILNKSITENRSQIYLFKRNARVCSNNLAKNQSTKESLEKMIAAFRRELDEYYKEIDLYNADIVVKNDEIQRLSALYTKYGVKFKEYDAALAPYRKLIEEYNHEIASLQ